MTRRRARKAAATAWPARPGGRGAAAAGRRGALWHDARGNWQLSRRLEASGRFPGPPASHVLQGPERQSLGPSYGPGESESGAHVNGPGRRVDEHRDGFMFSESMPCCTLQGLASLSD